ncbi:MAG TPA: FxLYD domain-containing protein [Candidatus Saccharimonadia bacterium]|nr:FxLYD domain-containing protein [Candidatus Saccharimonadia bacterium]
MSTSRRLFTIVGVVVVAVGAALLWAESGNKFVNERPAGETPAATASPATKERTTLANSKVTTNAAGYLVVSGSITNNEDAARSATITATFLDKAGKALGTATGTVSDIDPAQTKPFVLTSTEKLATYYEVKVAVDKLF